MHRELYRGQVVWNRTQKRNQWGQKRQQERPETDWIRLDAPELRIVSDQLWQAVHGRLAGVRQHYLRWTGGKLWGRPAAGVESKYLLTGLGSCEGCNGSIHVHGRSHGHGTKRRRVRFNDDATKTFNVRDGWETVGLLVQIGGPQPPISKMLSFEVDLI